MSNAIGHCSPDKGFRSSRESPIFARLGAKPGFLNAAHPEIVDTK
jgi:hypothetical protein